MLEGLIAWFVTTFLLGPLQSSMASQLQSARAPAAVIQQMARCAADATPPLLARAASEPWWAITTAIGTWTGSVTPAAVLLDAAPTCPPAIEAARPFLAAG
jgi:hypothetical protein